MWGRTLAGRRPWEWLWVTYLPVLYATRGLQESHTSLPLPAIDTWSLYYFLKHPSELTPSEMKIKTNSCFPSWNICQNCCDLEPNLTKIYNAAPLIETNKTSNYLKFYKSVYTPPCLTCVNCSPHLNENIIEFCYCFSYFSQGHCTPVILCVRVWEAACYTVR